MAAPPGVPHRSDPDAVLDGFARKLTQRLFDYMRRADVHTGGRADALKVVDFKGPDELRKALRMGIGQEPAALSDLLRDCDDVLRYSVNTNHIHFFNQLFSQVDFVGVMGEWLTSVVNTSMYTYEVAPVFILVEEYILRKVGELLGFRNTDGIFCAGGSQANMYSLLLARHRAFPHVKQRGWAAADRPVVFASEQSHYSTLKGCILTGMGLANCVSVACDEYGRMRPDELERAVQAAKAEGRTPFYAVATAGTTVLGAFDDIGALADVCRRHGLWLHVDGAWGGSAMLSPKLRYLLKGIDRADSFTWCAHKMPGAPLQCSIFVANDKQGQLQDANGTRASYLFQPDKLYPIEYDTGDKSIQCGRKVDCFKLWLLWKSRGDSGMAAHVEAAFAAAQRLAAAVQQRTSEGFELVAPQQCANVCFRYVPAAARSAPAERRQAIVDRIAPLVKREMQLHGTTLVGHQRLGKIPNFWRMICTNPNLTERDAHWLLDLIRDYSEKCMTECLAKL